MCNLQELKALNWLSVRKIFSSVIQYLIGVQYFMNALFWHLVTVINHWYKPSIDLYIDPLMGQFDIMPFIRLISKLRASFKR